MMPQFKEAVLKFCDEAHQLKQPVAVMNALHKVSQHCELAVFAAWYLPRQHTDVGAWHIDHNIFFHPSVDGEAFVKEYQTQFVSHCGSVLATYARITSMAFTLTEAMRLLQLQGDQNWVFDLLRRRFDTRDGLYCPFRNWAVFYQSRRVLQIDYLSRALLMLAGLIAVDQIGALVRRPEQFERSKVVLSKRETAVVQLLSHGKKNREIADDLGISIATVRTHVEHAGKKLKARNRGHAIAEAMRLGLL